jgi:hypothetical protein
MDLTTLSRVGSAISAAWPKSVVQLSIDCAFEIVLKSPYTGPEEEE